MLTTTTTTALSTAEANALRFLGNLFLRPRTISTIVEYWLCNYEPIARDTFALVPRSLEPSEFYHTLIARVLLGPDDLVLVGQGSLAAGNNTSNAPRYQHYLNFIQPSHSDFTLALPVRHFLETRERSVPMRALLPLFYEASHYWQRRGHGATMGQHLCSFFRPGEGTTMAWQRLFLPLAFVAEILYRVQAAVRAADSVAWQTTQGIAIVQRMMDALRQRSPTTVLRTFETAALIPYISAMTAELTSTKGALQKLATCRTLTFNLRSTMRAHVRDLYEDMAPLLEAPFTAEDADYLPWNRVSADAPESLAFLWDASVEANENADGMDIDAVV